MSHLNIPREVPTDRHSFILEYLRVSCAILGGRHKGEEQQLAVRSRVLWHPASETEIGVQEEVLLGSALGTTL